MAAGLLETLNFAFTSKSWLGRFGMTTPLTVLNPLSEEHEAMVPSLIPGLVRDALDNWNHHFGSESLPIRLFELRPVFSRRSGQALQAIGEMETGAQRTLEACNRSFWPALCVRLRNEQGEVDFYDLKAMIENVIRELGNSRVFGYQPLTASRTGGNPLFHPGQSVEILAGKEVAGHFGLLHPGKARELKARAPLWLAELDWEVLSEAVPSSSQPRIV